MTGVPMTRSSSSNVSLSKVASSVLGVPLRRYENRCTYICTNKYISDDGRAYDALLVVERVSQQGGQLRPGRAAPQVYINIFIYIQIHMYK